MEAAIEDNKFFFEAGWDVKNERPRRHRRGSWVRFERQLDITATTLRRRLRNTGYVRGKVRSGLCNYCNQWQVVAAKTTAG